MNPEAASLLRWHRCNPRASRIMWRVECAFAVVSILTYIGLIVATAIKHFK